MVNKARQFVPASSVNYAVKRVILISSLRPELEILLRHV